MWDLALQLQEELKIMSQQKHEACLKRDKLRTMWEISQRKLEVEESTLTTLERKREEAKKHHEKQITVYKQKMKDLSSEMNNTISQMKIDGATSSYLAQLQRTDLEMASHMDVYSVQEQQRLNQVQEQILMKDILLKHQMELTQFKSDHEEKLQNSLFESQKKKQSLLLETEEKLKKLNKYFDDDEMAAQVLAEQDKEITTILDNAIAAQVLAEQDKELNAVITFQKGKNTLKRLENAEKARNVKLFQATGSSNKHLEKADLQKPLKVKDYMVKYNAQKKATEKECTELSVKKEQLLQVVEELKREIDEMQKNQMDKILDLQQKSGLKRMLMEKQIKVLIEALEKKQTLLNTVLSVSSSNPETRSNVCMKLEEIMECKDKSNSTLQEGLARDCKVNDELLQATKASCNQLFDCPTKPTNQIPKAAAPSGSIS